MESEDLSPVSEQHAISDTGPQHDHARAYAALASMADAVYCVDTAGRFTFVNAAFEGMSGYTQVELQGTPSICLYVAETETLFMERRHPVGSDAPVSPYVETVLLLKDETRLAVELSVSNLIMAGQIAGRVVVVRDMTARRQTEEALRESEERLRLASPSADSLVSLEALWTEIRQRMGVCPSFFRLATPEPAIARTLFDLAQFAYLDSPLPTAFKEKLFTYLSRFCPVRYCVARHMAFLLGRGYMAGDPNAPALPAEEVVALLDEPLPDLEELPHLLEELEVQPVPLADWPAFESRLGKLVRVACARVLLESARSARWCQALRQLLGPQRYEQLMLFLAFVRTAHFWTEVHPELEIDGDVETLLEEHEALADSIRNDADTTLRFQIGARVAAELQELRHTAVLTDALRKSEERLAAILEQLPVAVGVIGTDGRITSANALWRAYVPQQIASRDPERIKRWRAFTDDGKPIPPHDWPGEQALCGRSVPSMDFLHTLDDGRSIWVRVSAAPFRDDGGNTIGAICAIEDIDARKCTEQTLRDLTATLEQRVAERTAALEQAMAEQQRLEREAQRAEHFALLGRLAAGVSHELRNPLAAVFLHVDLLAEELAQPSPADPAVMAEYLAELKAELARVDDIMQDYLSLVRVHAIQCEVQDLGMAVAAWCCEFREVVAAHGVTLQVEGVERLGPVAFHASTLRRALLNLVQNAAEAMPQGGMVTLVGQSATVQVQLQVCDTGSGISAECLPQIFEPLHTTKPGGTGLGLYIVQEVVKAHGGQVAVQSVEGLGTTFTLTLPRTAVEGLPA